jgi:hypothetical protein
MMSAPVGTAVEEAAPLPIAPIAGRRVDGDAPWPLSPAPAPLARANQASVAESFVENGAERRAVEQITERRQEDKQLQETFPEQSQELVSSPPRADQVLGRLQVARQALAQAKTIQQAKHISDIAEAIRTYTKRSGMAKEAQDDAASFAIEAEHRISKLYKTLKDQGMLATGSRGQLKGRKASGEVVNSPPEKRPTLADIAIGKDLAKRLRKLAPLSEEELAKRIEEKRAAHQLTKTAVLDDPKPKKEPATSRHFVAPLEDFKKAPSNYDPQQFVRDKKLRALYQAVGQQLHKFVDRLEVELLSGEIVTGAIEATPAIGH